MLLLTCHKVGGNMSLEDEMKNYLEELKSAIQIETGNINDWFEKEKHKIELELGSWFDFLRLQAQKQFKIAEVYRKYQLLEKITSPEQTMQDELKKQWEKGHCEFLQGARYGPHCTMPFDIGFSCPYMNKDALEEVLYFNGEKKLRYLCKFPQRNGDPQ